MPSLRPHFFDLAPAALRELLQSWSMEAYRADQVRQWVYERGVADPQRMSNLSKADRATLAQRMTFTAGRIVGHQVAGDGVQKLLMDWQTPQAGAGLALAPASDPRHQTECVMIPAQGEQRDRRTACISSQVGCPVGCKFCASGLGGLDGNLTAGRIVEQVWQLQQLPGVGRISHVVFMGMGEPLANFNEVTRAVEYLVAEGGLNISGRRITISTVGLPAQMRRLAELKIPLTLAISLHAPNDAVRRSLIPWADYVTIEQLIDAGRYYFQCTGREITLEYILLGNVNDRPEHARELATVARKLRSNVNLIRYNEVKGLPFGRPASEDVLTFQGILRQAGVNVHIRASRGRDIAAACGQLRHEHAQAASSS
jgi:23S rRNA (adenine2503-C2)-methyltransferase